MMMSSWRRAPADGGRQPRNGTNWNLLPVTACSERPLMCGGLARTAGAERHGVGIGFSHPISSARFFAGIELRDMISIGPFDSIGDRLEVLQRVSN